MIAGEVRIINSKDFSIPREESKVLKMGVGESTTESGNVALIMDMLPG